MAKIEFGIILRLIDQMSAPMRKIEAQMASMNRVAEHMEPVKKWGTTVAEAGAVAAGGGLAFAMGIKKSVEAADELQDHMNRLDVALGNTSNKAAQMAHANAFVAQQSIATGYDVGQLTESLYQGVSGFLSLDQSMALTTESAKLARSTQGDLADTTKMMSTLMLNFSDPTKTAIQNATMLSDKMAALQNEFKFTNLGDLNEAMKQAAPTALAYKISLDQVLASLATFSAGGLPGAESGTAFLEVIGQLVKKADKLGITLIRTPTGMLDVGKTLQEVQAKFQGTAGQTLLTQELGLRAGPRLQLLLQHLDKFNLGLHGIANSAGTVDRDFAVFNEKGSMVFQRLGAALKTIEISVGQALLPAVDKIAKAFLTVATRVQALTVAHPQLMHFAGVFLEITAGVLLALGAVGILVGGFALLVGVVAPVGALIGIGTAAIALFAAGAAAAAAAVISWWPQITGVFSSVVTGIESLFTKLVPKFFHWGAKLLKEFALGILSTAAAPANAIASVVTKLAKYLPRFSPAEIGPLSTLDRLPFSETLAESMKPAPVVAALNKIGQVAARGISLAVTPTVTPIPELVTISEAAHVVHRLIPAPPALVPPSPALVLHRLVPATPLTPSPAILMAAPRAASAAPSRGDIVIHYSPNITVNGASGSPQDWVKAMRQHGDELARIIRDKIGREERLRFE